MSNSNFDEELNKQKKVAEAIGFWLDDNGYKRGIHGFCQHKQGLPRIPNVLIRPTSCKHSGSRAVMVTPTSVLVCDISEPYQTSRWEVTRESDYTGKTELKSKLDELVYVDLGDWG